MIKIIKTLIKWYDNLAKWFQNKWGIDIDEDWIEDKDTVEDAFTSLGEAIVMILIVVMYFIIEWMFF